MERPDLCKGCERHCCTRPSLTTSEYLVMYQYVGNEKLQSFEPTWYPERGAWGFSHGCPASSETGCLMPYEQRPLLCKIFPWIAIPVYQDDIKDAKAQLFLSAGRCPQWKAFGDNYKEVLKEFENGC